MNKKKAKLIFKHNYFEVVEEGTMSFAQYLEKKYNYKT